MFVSQLDRPWIETPFPLQGFVVRTEEELQQLRALCKTVYVDEQRAVQLQPVRAASLLAAGKPRIRGALGRFTPVRYSTSVTVKKEVMAAAVSHQQVCRAVLALLADARQQKNAGVPKVRQAAVLVVESIVRNPDAMVWLSRLKDKDAYSYGHSVRCAVWATVFGRHLGLPTDTLINLATGCLLMDVGMTRLPRELLQQDNQRLSSEQQREYRAHVKHGLALLEQAEGVNDQVLAVVEYHHERHDGTGYPHGLKEQDIPLLARIAGIVDTYDALTSPRPWCEARTATEAVSLLYSERDKAFQGGLVERFIQAIGVYPTGTLVEMSNREVAIVIAQNPTRRLRPQVMVVQDGQGKVLETPRFLDLIEVETDDAGVPLNVAACLHSHATQVDVARLTLNVA